MAAPARSKPTAGRAQLPAAVKKNNDDILRVLSQVTEHDSIEQGLNVALEQLRQMQMLPVDVGRVIFSSGDDPPPPPPLPTQFIDSKHTSADDQRNFKEMATWLLQNGARFPHLQLRSTPTASSHDPPQRSVFLRAPVADGQILIAVPQKCIIGTQAHKKDPVWRVLKRAGLREQREVAVGTYLACVLLEERAKGAASFFAPYIATLPTDMSHMPVLFNDDDMHWLKGSFAHPRVLLRRQVLTDEYRKVCEVLDKKDLSQPNPAGEDAPRLVTGRFSKRHSLADWLWARSIVYSRSFAGDETVRSWDGSHFVLLVPLADMINHTAEAEYNAKYTCAKDNAAHLIIATQASSAGGEVLLSYGDRCNSRSLINYGFCLPNNEKENEIAMWLRFDVPHDICIALSSNEQEEWLRSRQKLLHITEAGLDEELGRTVSPISSMFWHHGGMFSLSPTAAGAALDAYPPPNALRFQFVSDLQHGPAMTMLNVMRAVLSRADARAATPLAIVCGVPDSFRAEMEPLFAAIKKLQSQVDSMEGLSEAGVVEQVFAAAAKLDQSPGNAIRFTPLLSIRNELAVLRCLADAVETALKQFDTTLNEDEALLCADGACKPANSAGHGVEGVSGMFEGALFPLLSRLPADFELLRAGEDPFKHPLVRAFTRHLAAALKGGKSTFDPEETKTWMALAFAETLAQRSAEVESTSSASSGGSRGQRGLLSSTQRHCLLMRIGEKRGLHQILFFERMTRSLAGMLVRFSAETSRLAADASTAGASLSVVWRAFVASNVQPRLRKAEAELRYSFQSYFRDAFLPLLQYVADAPPNIRTRILATIPPTTASDSEASATAAKN